MNQKIRIKGLKNNQYEKQKKIGGLERKIRDRNQKENK